MNLRITGTGLAVPGRVQTAGDLAPLVQRSAEWISLRAGQSRHTADDDDDVEELAAQAARLAIPSGRHPQLIIYAGVSSRQLLPDTSVFLQRALNLSGLPCFTIHANCNSFIVALSVSATFIASGLYENALICSAELATRARDFRDPESAALLGDGAAAAFIEKSNESAGLIAFNMRTWPEAAEFCQITGGGLRRHPLSGITSSQDYLFSMNGPKLYKFLHKMARPFLVEFLGQQGMTVNDVDVVVPHQPSVRALEVLPHLGFESSRIINIIHEYGNCVAASAPMALAHAVKCGRIQRGHTVLFLGTGAGVSIAAALYKW